MSLIEVILSITVLGLALSLLTGLIPSSAINQRQATNLAVAGDLAQSAVEDYGGRDVAALPTSQDLGTTESGGQSFQTQLYVERLTDPDTAYKLKAVVTYQTGQVVRRVFRERVVVALPR